MLVMQSDSALDHVGLRPQRSLVEKEWAVLPGDYDY
jgi:hypothetical protein